MSNHNTNRMERMGCNANDPAAEYRRRIDDRREDALRLDRRDALFSTARGIVFLLTLLFLLGYVCDADVPLTGSIVCGVVFISLVVWHNRVARRLTTVRRAMEYYQRGVERLHNRWAGHGASGTRYADSTHPYTGDLDVFGDGSLFQLISRARTRLGEDTLANWLSKPADPATIQARQHAIQELRSRLDLREELALLHSDDSDEADQNHLHKWACESTRLIRPIDVLLAVILACAFVAALAGWFFAIWGTTPVLLVLIAEVALLFQLREPIRLTGQEAGRAGSGLAILAQVLAVIERQSFDRPELKELVSHLSTDGILPSRDIARLRYLIAWLENCLLNQFYAPAALALCLPVHAVHRIENWRIRVGPGIDRWLAAVGQIEALSSLAGYAFEHPADPFPTVMDGATRFEAEQLGHPLLPESDCVGNDVAIGHDVQLLLVSGSNMSGKSTLLRSVGTNVILALAGAPVRAKSLRLSPVQLGTAMRVQDSLQAGASLFYASVARIKSVVSLSERDQPLLFLFDEILQGTNSHDRRIGAEGIIQQLLDRDAVGLVTTHDLALTEIVAALGNAAANVHFEDQWIDGRMSFDYRLRPGVIARSNALELMRLVGLNVPDESE